MILRLLTIVLTSLLLFGCGRADDPGADSADTASAAEAPATGLDGATGVPECDDFLARYEACLAQVPAEARGGMQMALETWRATWVTMARGPTTRGNLAPICARTAENAMAALAQYDCPR